MSMQSLEHALPKRKLASPQMRKVRPLSPYMENNQQTSQMNLAKYTVTKKDPAELLKNNEA